MPRNMSFALNIEQIKDQTKTVTRRLGWRHLKRGDRLQPVEKAMGLKKGEKIKRIGGPIVVTTVTHSRIADITPEDVVREGFPNLTPPEFINMFCQANNARPVDYVSRISFAYGWLVNNQPDVCRHQWELVTRGVRICPLCDTTHYLHHDGTWDDIPF